jgi:hypothetical protein
LAVQPWQFYGLLASSIPAVTLDAPEGYHARWVCAAILQSGSRLLVRTLAIQNVIVLIALVDAYTSFCKEAPFCSPRPELLTGTSCAGIWFVSEVALVVQVAN